MRGLSSRAGRPPTAAAAPSHVRETTVPLASLTFLFRRKADIARRTECVGATAYYRKTRDRDTRGEI